MSESARSACATQRGGDGGASRQSTSSTDRRALTHARAVFLRRAAVGPQRMEEWLRDWRRRRRDGVGRSRRAWPIARMQWWMRPGPSRRCAISKPLPSPSRMLDVGTRQFSKTTSGWPLGASGSPNMHIGRTIVIPGVSIGTSSIDCCLCTLLFVGSVSPGAARATCRIRRSSSSSSPSREPSPSSSRTWFLFLFGIVTTHKRRPRDETRRRPPHTTHTHTRARH